MRLCVCCSTYNRPHLLPRVIRSFREQDYPERYRCMLIYDDASQYETQWIGDNIRLISTATREKSLGIKRNRCIELAQETFGDIDGVLPCDDDDFFLPWHLTASAWALERAEWSRPSVVISGAHIVGDVYIFRKNYTGHKDDQTKERLYHPCWAMRVDAIKRSGGYPEHLSGPEDRGLMLKMEAAGITQADYCEKFPPAYVYCWRSGESISSFLDSQKDPNGEAAWKRLECQSVPTVLEEWVPPFDLRHLPVADYVFPRPF